MDFIFGDNKMADNRHSFAVLNKNKVVVFIMTLFWGHTGRAMHRECMSVLLWLFCSSISGGPRVGPNLIAHVSSKYK